MYKNVNLITLIFLLLSASAAVTSGQEKLGKIFIKAALIEVDGKQIPDTDSEESVKDIKKRPGKFILVDKESEADFLIVVNERTSTPQSGSPAAKSIHATLYTRDAGKWTPATKLISGSNDIFWGIAAENIVKKATKWVKENTNK